MWRYAGWWKYKTDAYKTLPVSFLLSHKYLQWWLIWWTMRRTRGGEEVWSIGLQVYTSESSNYCRVIFTQTTDAGEKVNHNYKIQLSRTKCNYWWYRYWFICPCSGRRCSILYLQPNGIFCDRVALDLVYDSQYVNKNYRWLDKIMWSWKADELYASIKYKYRNGKPTRKYRRYLKMTEYSEYDYRKAMDFLTRGSK